VSGWPDIPTPELEGDPLHPMCPYCKRFAADMDELDGFLFDSEEDYADNGPATAEMREAYVGKEEGTFNPANGHFACDGCYVAIGQPSSRSGWTCP